MSPHKFKVGDLVAINPTMGRFVPSGVFEIIKQLPGSNEPEYHIKSTNEPHQRLALEKRAYKGLSPRRGFRHAA
jgi:hypothetical protein